MWYRIAPLGYRMPVTLNGWKQIASFLNLKPKTAQMWEKEHGMPVHRIGNGASAPVFAFRAEIAQWLRVSNMESAGLPGSHVSAPLKEKDLVARNRELRTELRRQMHITHQHLLDLAAVRESFRKASRSSNTSPASRQQHK